MKTELFIVLIYTATVHSSTGTILILSLNYCTTINTLKELFNFCVIINLFLLLEQPTNPYCPGNMTYKFDGGCDEFCDPSPDRICSVETSRPGCYCDPGYIRLGESSPCVLPEDCVECGENMFYQWCGTPCPKYCGMIPSRCGFGCRRGCFCREPYVFESQNSTECVLESECPKNYY